MLGAATAGMGPMKVSCLKVTALAAVSLALMGCASTSSLVRVGLLGAARGKDPVAMQNSLVAAGSLLDPEEALRQAQALRKSADFQGAAKLLSQLAQASPDDARVLGEYAKTLIALNRPSDGLTYVDRAIALEPDDWTLHVRTPAKLLAAEVKFKLENIPLP